MTKAVGYALSFFNPWAYGKTTTQIVVAQSVLSAATTYAQNRALESVTQVSDPLLDRAYQTIKTLKEQISSKNFSAAESAQMAETLKRVPQTLLSLGEYGQIQRLCVQITQGTLYTDNDRITKVEIVHEIILRKWAQQTGVVARVIDAAQTQLSRGGTPTAASSTVGLGKMEADVRATLAARVVMPSLPVGPQENRMGGIETEFKRLRSNVLRILLGQLVLPPGKNTTVLKIMKEVSSDGDFKDRIYEQIDLTRYNIITRSLSKWYFNFLEAILSYYLTTFFDNFLSDIKLFVEKDPDKRLEDFVQVGVNPAIDFFTFIQDTLKTISDKTGQNKAPVRTLGDRINQAKIGELTQQQLLHKLMRAFLRYAPQLHWATSASDHFYSRGKDTASFVAKTWFYGWYCLFAIIGKIIAPLQWSVNKTIHKILENALAKVAFPSLYQSTMQAIGVGSLYLHSMNDFMLRKLNAIEFQILNPQDTGPRSEQHASRMMEKTFSQFVRNLLETLTTLDKAQVLNNLREFQANNAAQTVLRGIDEGLTSSIKSTLTTQLLSLLESFLQKESLEDFLLQSLRNLNEQCFNPTSITITPEEMKITEQRRSGKLKELVALAVNKAVDDIFNPAQNIQAAANGFVDGFKNDIRALNQNIQTLPPNDTGRLYKLWADTHASITSRYEHAKSRVNGSTQEAMLQILDRFRKETPQIAERIRELHLKGEEKRAKQAPLQKLQGCFTRYLLNKPDDRPEKNIELLTALCDHLRGPYSKALSHSLTQFKVSLDQIIKFPLARQKGHNELIEQHIKLCRLHIEKMFETEQFDSIQMSRDFALVKKDLEPLSAWAQTVQPIACGVEDSVVLRGAEKIVSGVDAKKFFTDKIYSIADDLFTFLHESHHMKGLLRYIAAGYLERRNGA